MRSRNRTTTSTGGSARDTHRRRGVCMGGRRGGMGAGRRPGGLPDSTAMGAPRERRWVWLPPRRRSPRPTVRPEPRRDGGSPGLHAPAAAEASGGAPGGTGREGILALSRIPSSPRAQDTPDLRPLSKTGAARERAQCLRGDCRGPPLAGAQSRSRGTPGPAGPCPESGKENTYRQHQLDPGCWETPSPPPPTSSPRRADAEPWERRSIPESSRPARPPASRSRSPSLKGHFYFSNGGALSRSAAHAVSLKRPSPGTATRPLRYQPRRSGLRGRGCPGSGEPHAGLRPLPSARPSLRFEFLATELNKSGCCKLN